MSKSLSRQELEIMKLIWRLDQEEVTVRDVYEELRLRRRIAYTSVMGTMQSLDRKGFLRKWKEGRAHVYQPTRPREEVIREVVADLVARVFGGSSEALMLHLVERHDISREKLRELERMIEEGK
jgi:predicted transcriptional regulator